VSARDIPTPRSGGEGPSKPPPFPHENSIARFILAILDKTPNGEWIEVQFHPNGDWSVGGIRVNPSQEGQVE